MITLYAIAKIMENSGDTFYLSVDDGVVIWWSFPERAKLFDREIVFDIVRVLNAENTRSAVHYSAWAIQL